MKYKILVPNDPPVLLADWRAVENYLYLLERTDWNAYVWAIVQEVQS